MYEIRCIQSANATLGEGPIWDAARGVLYWCDLQRPAVFRYDPVRKQTGFWPLGKPIGCVAPTTDPKRLILADAGGVAFLDLDSGGVVRIGDPEADLTENLFNDGKVDRAGRFWAATLGKQQTEPVGNLYRIDRELSIHKMDSGFICSNGIGWSPDNRTMYFTDSGTRTIWAYEFDIATGELGERRIFAKLSEGKGLPDGLTVDSEGFVWSAVWDGWRVIRYAADGTIDREFPVPVQRPTSCMFGGPDLRTLFITSASTGLDWQALKNGSLAGALFAMETNITGIPEVQFKLAAEH